MLYYFAYGSNLHPLRLMERVPSARLIGAIELNQYRLLFHKQSQDESGKCNLIHTKSPSDLVYGALYAMDPAQKQVLDDAEGKGCGYQDHQIRVQLQEREYFCATYVAQPSYIVEPLKPYCWYKRLVLLGAEYLQFPKFYLRALASVSSVEDPDETRRMKHETLIERIRKYC